MFRVLVIVSFVLGIWIGFGGPIPLVVERPLATNPDAPTFAATVKDFQAHPERHELPEFKENPLRLAVQKDIAGLSKRLVDYPCARTIREAFLQAVRQLDTIPFGEDEPVVVLGGVKINPYGSSTWTNIAISKALETGAFHPSEVRFMPVAFRLKAAENYSEGKCKT
ncbi:hypothetical protein GR183_10560 [Stappia sp. GBMRC 2046]|uniref:Uncharacterized protein n=1 Tax=Stappia sediminis TaxID=2692190 RepID=A0A7X3S818_9HYPH|nr:hypothetical protein [Stappia sediminis]MXN65342.1 hypothetical protein [Stappia sediminis]